LLKCFTLVDLEEGFLLHHYDHVVDGREDWEREAEGLMMMMYCVVEVLNDIRHLLEDVGGDDDDSVVALWIVVILHLHLHQLLLSNCCVDYGDHGGSWFIG